MPHPADRKAGVVVVDTAVDEGNKRREDGRRKGRAARNRVLGCMVCDWG